MPSLVFEHTISAGETPQTYVLDREATDTSGYIYISDQYNRSSTVSFIFVFYTIANINKRRDDDNIC